MATKNDVTGDSIQTKTVSDAYRNNYDAIFGKSKQKITIDDPVEVDTGSSKEELANFQDFLKNNQDQILSDPVSASKEWTEEEKQALQDALTLMFPIENIPPLPEKGSGKHHNDSLYLQGRYKSVDCE